MPITPFHIGPGILIKSFVPDRFSWAMFVLANVAMDLEPIGGFLLIGDPLHGNLHSFFGATVLALVCARFGSRGCERCLDWWNRKLSPSQAQWLHVDPRITPAAANAGALVGTWSHILLDSFMHADVRPFWPLADSNDFVGLVAVYPLHVVLTACGLWGILRLFTAQWDRIAATPAAVVEPARRSFPAGIAGKSIRILAGLARTAIGLLCLVWMAMLALESSAKHQMARDSFDAVVWNSVDKPIRLRANPRIHMASDLVRQLEARRPSRIETEALLGSKTDYADAEMLSYFLGSPDLSMYYYVLIVNFEKDGRFKGARLRSGPD